MSEFINNTYSAYLLVVTTLFALSYPLVIGCIEKIDDKYHSTKLSERFKNENYFVVFKVLLIINIFWAICIPFINKFFDCGCFLVAIQFVLIIPLLVSAFLLFRRIMVYYTPHELKNDIIESFDKSNYSNKGQLFILFVEIVPSLLKSSDVTLVKSVNKLVDGCLNCKCNKKDEESDYDIFLYEGVSRINEYLCQLVEKPISVNNSNDIINCLMDSNLDISDLLYGYLWHNLRIQLSYKKNEWIMEYWKKASQSYELDKLRNNLDEHDYCSSFEGDTNRANIRWSFFEFNIMLCSMILQEKNYQLLNLMLSFSQSIPPKYPLVPSTLNDIINVFNRINSNGRSNPIHYEKMYSMPNMYGITEGKIVGAANLFLALLAYRVYTLIWVYGPRIALGTGKLPDSLHKLQEYNDNLRLFEFWLEKVKSIGIVKDVLFRDADDIIKDKEDQFENSCLPNPNNVIGDMKKEIESKIGELRKNQPLDDIRTSKECNEVNHKISTAIQNYDVFINGEKLDGECRCLGQCISMPFPNTAFVRNPDVEHIGVADCIADSLLRDFRYYFATAFYSANIDRRYNVASEDVFLALDRLCLNENHCIVAFDVFFDFYIDKVRGLIKKSDFKYEYYGVGIIMLNCPYKEFSSQLFILRKSDLPVLSFSEQNRTIIEEYKMKKVSVDYGLWLSVNKIIDCPKLLKEPIKSQLGDKANEHSLFTAFWNPLLSFKKDYTPIVSIKVKYRLYDEGQYDDLNTITAYR